MDISNGNMKSLQFIGNAVQTEIDFLRQVFPNCLIRPPSPKV